MNNQIYVVLKRLRNKDVILKMKDEKKEHLYDIVDTVFISDKLELAKKNYDTIRIEEYNYWKCVGKYLIKTQMNTDYLKREGLINQDCLFFERPELKIN